MNNKSFSIHTLGCKLNYSESSALSKQLIEHGFTKKEFQQNPDIYIINTCSVTDNADKECQQIIRKINKQNPESFIVVTGCYAQLKPKEIVALEGVDLVLGASEKFNLITHLNNIQGKKNPQIYSCEIEDVSDFKSAFSYNDRTRAFLKLQDGCDYSCSYCTIPMARGKSRSDDLNNILKNVETLAQKGIKEIVLTGINLGDYQHNEKRIIDVLKILDHKAQVPRFRISSIEPNLLTDECLELVSNSKCFMPHFHIPLQSGSNKILGLMRRRYQRELYASLVKKINQRMPQCAIGVDVIVGFPDEQEEDFNDTYNFLHDLDISYLHVFTYSERTGTSATEIKNSVPIHIRKQRNKILRSLSMQKKIYFESKFKNSTRMVLFESQNKKNMMEGYTDNYIKVETFYNPSLTNQVVKWKI